MGLESCDIESISVLEILLHLVEFIPADGVQVPSGQSGVDLGNSLVEVEHGEGAFQVISHGELVPLVVGHVLHQSHFAPRGIQNGFLLVG